MLSNKLITLFYSTNFNIIIYYWPKLMTCKRLIPSAKHMQADKILCIKFIAKLSMYFDMENAINYLLPQLNFFADEQEQNIKKEILKSIKNGEYNFMNPYPYFYAYSADEKRTLEVIKEIYDHYKYIVDPHTAVAYDAYLKYKNQTKDNALTVVVSTASPFKFPQTVLEAFRMDEDDPFKAIYVLSKEFDLEIPSVLNYEKRDRFVVDLSECEKKVEELIKCLKS